MTEPMDRVHIEAELREILRELVRHPERPIDPGDHLVFDLEIEDDDIVFDMIPQIHRRFDVEIPGFAWESVATFQDLVALVERYQRQPATAAERARDEADRRESSHLDRLYASRFLAVMGTAAGMELSGGYGVALCMLAFALWFISRLPGMRRDARDFRRDRDAWKARRAAERENAG
jgi:acyl carrier protein